jgi:hypothetical protein
MFKKIPVVLVWFIFIGIIFSYLINPYHLVAKTYYVDESKLYKVDTFHLLDRAYEQSDNSGGGRLSSKTKLVFESTNRYSFAIDDNIFQAIIDPKKLEDTLQYHDLKFTVYTTKGFFEKYKTTNSPIFIKVYQIQIGETKYIDISKLNKLSKGGALRGTIIPPVFIFFFGFLLYKTNQSQSWWTKRRIIIWGITFILTLIGLLLLT